MSDFRRMLPHLSLLLLLVAGLPSSRTGAADPKPPAWKTAATVDLKGLKVSLSEPVLVARSKGYLWFPTLLRLENSDLLAILSNYPDAHTASATSLVCWSGDGGLTWSEPKEALYSDSNLRLANGDHLLLPYYLYPQQDGMGAPYQLVPKGKREIRTVKEGVRVAGWPRPDRSLEPKLGLSGFVFNGQTVTLTDGGYLATLYGYFKDTKRYSLVVAESRDGVDWKVRATVADENCKLKGSEGPCEAALCRLKDRRLMCVYRMNSGDPYGQSWSSDEGRTWTEPAAMKDTFSVQPSLAVLKDGTVVLSGGRPNLYAWFNLDGSGKDWQRLALHEHHNACHPKEPIDKPGHTSSYTEIIALDDTHLLYIYDRVPHGWSSIPKDSPDTNGVWVVRLTLERPGK
jgi:hypothetical protein